MHWFEVGVMLRRRQTRAHLFRFGVLYAARSRLLYVATRNQVKALRQCPSSKALE
jgi:hypothetical protein